MNSSYSDLWQVLLVFLIPFGGGIPAGVVLGHSKGLAWPLVMGLYVISDILLAFAFEPLTWGVGHLARRFSFVARLLSVIKQSTFKTIALFGLNPGPLTLIMISFGVDPMTGRTAALAAGHGFVTGWALAIAGDLIFFTLLMVSTLWLNAVLGNGTWAVIIVMLLMLALLLFSKLIRHFFKKKRPLPKTATVSTDSGASRGLSERLQTIF